MEEACRYHGLLEICERCCTMQHRRTFQVVDLADSVYSATVLFLAKKMTVWPQNGRRLCQIVAVWISQRKPGSIACHSCPDGKQCGWLTFFWHRSCFWMLRARRFRNVITISKSSSFLYTERPEDKWIAEWVSYPLSGCDAIWLPPKTKTPQSTFFILCRVKSLISSQNWLAGMSDMPLELE